MLSDTISTGDQTRDEPLYHLEGTLIPTAPFDFAQSLAFMRRFTPMAGEQALAGDGLTKAVALNGRAVVFSVRGEGTVEQPRLAYTLTSATPITEAEHAQLRDRISFFLSLEDDLRSFYALAREDTALAPTIQRLYGLHQPKFLTPFELACWAILTQRTPMPIARQIKDRITARYGHTLTVDGVTYHAFPEVDALAAVDLYEFAEIIRNARKTEYLLAVIELFDGVDEAWMRSAPLAEVQARLRATRGLGEWSSTFILIRGLGRMNATLTSEGELQKAAERIYNDGKPLSAAEFAALNERYSAERGYWAFYCRNALGRDA